VKRLILFYFEVKIELGCSCFLESQEAVNHFTIAHPTLQIFTGSIITITSAKVIFIISYSSSSCYNITTLVQYIDC
jgi:hypothetical protein